MDKLLQLLDKNSNYTADELSAMTGLNIEDVKAQIKKYESEGIIKGYRALINWDKVPNAETIALVELKVIPKRETGFDEIAEEIMQYDQVDSVYLMAGSYDLLVYVKGKTIQDISLFISQRLATIGAVQSTATKFMLKKYKECGIDMSNDNEVEKRSFVV